ncbi:MAG: dihydropteroate synthase [Bacteroidota bacterium]
MKPTGIGRPIFQWGSRTYVMGILNMTPDSFSGDGIMSREHPIQAAVDQARDFLADGADILDIGGESTRPGAAALGAEEEAARVLPVIRALAAAFPDAVLSIDTYKARVAREAFEAGAHMLNDVWGLRADAELAGVAAEYGAAVILMHNRSDPNSLEVRGRLGSAYRGSQYGNLLEDVKRELMESVEIARQAGIEDSRIILDPGIGFGKTREQNLKLVNHLDEIRALGYPVLVGPSRKSFIGYTLEAPPDQRVEGTAAVVAVAILRGADIIRVHDVHEMARVAKMTDALLRSN